MAAEQRPAAPYAFGDADIAARRLAVLDRVFGPSSRDLLADADLIYCRMLLAHLPDPVSAVRSWATQLTENGLVLVDEIEWIRTSHPVLRGHLRLAAGLVAASGARMSAGPLLARLSDAPDLQTRGIRIAEVQVPTAVAAAMFSMNIAVWRGRPAGLGLCDAAELRDLASTMATLTTSAATGEITWGMHQAAYAR